MKMYNALRSFQAIHKIKVNFQDDDYKGHIVYSLGGNYRGLNVLGFDPDMLEADDIDDLEENTANLKLDDEGYFTLMLSNENGKTFSYLDIDSRELCNMIVCIEIVDYKED